MGVLRSVTAADIITKVRYEIQADARQFVDNELLRYINKSLNIIYSMLVDLESDLVLTGSETFNTVAGTETYDRATASMDDLWAMNKIWVSTYEPMEQVEEAERYDYVNQEEDGNTGGRSIPEKYYFAGDNIGLLPIPDAIYTVRATYYPDFTPLSSITSTIPFKNIFNLEIVECVIVIARNRNNKKFALQEVLHNIFADRAKRIMKKRRTILTSISPRLKRQA